MQCDMYDLEYYCLFSSTRNSKVAVLRMRGDRHLLISFDHNLQWRHILIVFSLNFHSFYSSRQVSITSNKFRGS